RPDRVEFFYPKCGCLRPAPGMPGDPHAQGPPLKETGVDYQELRPYFEFAPSDRWSAFLEVPYRFINPDVNANANGIADMVAGAKYAFIADKCQYLTAQFSTYIPTGYANNGLGVRHTSIEPALLYYRAMGERLTLQGEVRDWISIGGSDFAGNVLRYGLGL